MANVTISVVSMKPEPLTQEQAEKRIEEIKHRVFKNLEDSMAEVAQREARRRAAWMAEEEERRLRMKAEVTVKKADGVREHSEELKQQAQEELLHVVNYAKAIALEEEARTEREMEILKDEVSRDIVREVSRTEVLIAEAKERQRRIHEGNNEMLSDLHEKVQQEFMSHVSRLEARKQEEVERQRRVALDKKKEAIQDFGLKVQRNLDYLKAIIAEEGERNRRIAEEIGNPFEEEIVREITRRETWLEEEKERARRILESDQSEIETAVERIFAHDRVIQMEEEERDRRIREDAERRSQAHEAKVHPGSAEPSKQKDITEFPSEVQEEFMSYVSRLMSHKAEDKERERRLKTMGMEDEIRSEANRFLTWALEERERRRRIYEEMLLDYQELLERKVLREQVVVLEEQERERRIRIGKTHKLVHEHEGQAGSHPTKKDAQELATEQQNEKVKEEFMSVVDRKLARASEEEERARRLAEEKLLQWRDEERAKIESSLSRIATRRVEEIERERRIREDLEKEFKEKLDSEMDRRKAIALEEEERLRRMVEGKLKLTDADEQKKKELLAQVVAHANETAAR